MRSCIYCGKEIEKGENCNCPQSVMRRSAKNTENTEVKKEDSSYNNPNYSQDSYTTGYTKKESKIKSAWNRHKMKRSMKAASKSPSTGLWTIVKAFCKSPIDTVANPPHIGKIWIMLIAAIEGAFLWTCMYFMINNIQRGPIAMLASFLSFNTEVYKSIGYIALTLLSGAISGLLIFFIYTGVFYLINRVVFRLNTGYWEFSQRLVLTGIPFALISIIGVFTGLFSSLTLVIFLLCGAVSWIVLTYEALKCEWYEKSSSKTMYAMLIGFLVIFSIVGYLMLLA